MCMDCENEHREWCSKHVESCTDDDCEMCKAIDRDGILSGVRRYT